MIPLEPERTVLEIGDTKESAFLARLEFLPLNIFTEQRVTNDEFINSLRVVEAGQFIVVHQKGKTMTLVRPKDEISQIHYSEDESAGTVLKTEGYIHNPDAQVLIQTLLDSLGNAAELRSDSQ